MKNCLFYFSATGNSLKVAKDLAGELVETEIVSIPKAIRQRIDSSFERIGLIYPVYMFGIPLIVKRFIEKLTPQKNSYLFSIVTCGGKAGNTLGQNAELLKAKGLTLSAGFIIKMPGNYTPLYEAIPAEKQNKMFQQEKRRIKEIAHAVEQKEQKKIEKDAPLLRGLLSAVYRQMSPKIPFLDKDFWADEKCNSCATCVRVCPVNNIKLPEGRPVWLRKCEQCFGCLHWCPTEAIQYGKNTPGRKRYRNPEIKLEEIISSK